MSRPSVLMVHPSGELYGSDRVFAESVRAMVEAGWEVLVAVPREGPLAGVLRECGARVFDCPTPVLRKATLRPAGLVRLLVEAVTSLPPMLRLLLEHRVEAIYVNTVTVPLWPLLAALLGHRVLTHVHEAEETVARPVRTALALPLLACRVVVVNSRATGAALRDCLPLLHRRIRLVHNGVAGPDRTVRPDRQPGTPARIVLVGRLSPRKGTDVAVHALARLRQAGHEVSLTLVGSVFTGYEWFERQLRETIRQHSLEDSVRMTGFDSDVWHHCAGADVAVVPSRFEPFGNTAVEAQLAGVPVVVSDVQGLPETVGGGSRGRIVPPGDPQALADAIAATLRDWPRSQRTARLAAQRTRVLFSPRRYRTEIAGILTTLAGERGRR